MFEQLAGVRGRLAALVTALDPNTVTGTAAGQLWAEFDRVERLAAAAKTLLARRVAATHDGEQATTRSPAEDLARRAGTTTGAAKDALDTSRRLPDLPGVDAAQAALISAAAHADPAATDRLLDLAGRASMTELREECARVRAAAEPDPDATNRRLHQQRRLRERHPPGPRTHRGATCGAAVDQPHLRGAKAAPAPASSGTTASRGRSPATPASTNWTRCAPSTTT